MSPRSSWRSIPRVTTLSACAPWMLASTCLSRSLSRCPRPTRRRFTRRRSRGAACSSVGHLLLHNRAIRQARQIVANGLLGERPAFASHRATVGTPRRPGSVWWALAPHDVSLALYLFDALPTSITATGSNWGAAQEDNAAAAVLHFPGGHTAHIQVARFVANKRRDVTIAGIDATLTFDELASTDAGAPAVETASGQQPSCRGSGSTHCGRSAWTSSARVARGDASTDGGAHAVDVVRVLEAGERSMRQAGAAQPVGRDGRVGRGDPPAPPCAGAPRSRRRDAILGAPHGDHRSGRAHRHGHEGLALLSRHGRRAASAPAACSARTCSSQRPVSWATAAAFRTTSRSTTASCSTTTSSSVRRRPFTNVRTPRAGVNQRATRSSERRSGRGATIGANATIVCGVSIGAHAFVAAGAVVTREHSRARAGVGRPRPTDGKHLRVRPNARFAREGPPLRLQPALTPRESKPYGRCP